jgi:hypothetical protein
MQSLTICMHLRSDSILEPGTARLPSQLMTPHDFKEAVRDLEHLTPIRTAQAD